MAQTSKDKATPESLGLVWRHNVSHGGNRYHPEEGEIFGEARQPETSTMTPNEFKKAVSEKSLIGVYGPPQP